MSLTQRVETQQNSPPLPVLFQSHQRNEKEEDSELRDTRYRAGQGRAWPERGVVFGLKGRATATRRGRHVLRRHLRYGTSGEGPCRVVTHSVWRGPHRSEGSPGGTPRRGPHASTAAP